MLRLLIRVAIAALIANAVWRLGSEYVTYFQFKDEVRSAATSGKGSDEDLRSRIDALAERYDISIEEGAVRVMTDASRSVEHAIVEVYYVKPIELVPGYEYPWRFSFTVDTLYSKRF
jgi:hypothetical protein